MSELCIFFGQQLGNNVHRCHKHSLCSLQRQHSRVMPCCSCPDKTVKQPDNPAAPCRHLGEQVSVEGCSSCSGSVSIPIFACTLHEECQLGRQSATTRSCLECPEYEELK